MALAMTQTWFNMLPQDIKNNYIQSFGLYIEAFSTIYKQAQEKIKQQKNDAVQEFGNDENSLNGKIL